MIWYTVNLWTNGIHLQSHGTLNGSRRIRGIIVGTAQLCEKTCIYMFDLLGQSWAIFVGSIFFLPSTRFVLWIQTYGVSFPGWAKSLNGWSPFTRWWFSQPVLQPFSSNWILLRIMAKIWEDLHDDHYLHFMICRQMHANTNYHLLAEHGYISTFIGVFHDHEVSPSRKHFEYPTIPPKTNISPEKCWLEDSLLFWNCFFLVTS